MEGKNLFKPTGTCGLNHLRVPDSGRTVLRDLFFAFFQSNFTGPVVI
jgi:hypothetical protein